MTREEFKRHFRDTAIERTKRRGLLRNVCVAMGNSGNTTFMPLLESLLDDEEALVREHAAWALARLRDCPPAPRRLLS
jgi:epoxyqueuosine reductase